MPTIPIAGGALPLVGIRSFGFQRSATHTHNGIDLPAPIGTPVRAAHGGFVQYATREWRQGFSGYGRTIVVANDDGTFALYGHLEDVSVEAGEPVNEGDVIGSVGTTEYAAEDHHSHVSGPHVHFEVSANPYPQQSTAPRLDPVAWLRGEREITRPIARPFAKAADAPQAAGPDSSLHSQSSRSAQSSSEGGDDEA